MARTLGERSNIAQRRQLALVIIDYMVRQLLSHLVRCDEGSGRQGVTVVATQPASLHYRKIQHEIRFWH